jgi:hypothetical protein
MSSIAPPTANEPESLDSDMRPSDLISDQYRETAKLLRNP